MRKVEALSYAGTSAEDFRDVRPHRRGAFVGRRREGGVWRIGLRRNDESSRSNVRPEDLDSRARGSRSSSAGA